MLQIILLVLIPFLIGIIYTYFIDKISENIFLLFLPAILGSLWFLYIFTIYKPEDSVGLAGLEVLIYGLIAIGSMGGNIISGLYFKFRTKKKN